MCSQRFWFVSRYFIIYENVCFYLKELEISLYPGICISNISTLYKSLLWNSFCPLCTSFIHISSFSVSMWVSPVCWLSANEISRLFSNQKQNKWKILAWCANEMQWKRRRKGRTTHIDIMSSTHLQFLLSFSFLFFSLFVFYLLATKWKHTKA